MPACFNPCYSSVVQILAESEKTHNSNPVSWLTESSSSSPGLPINPSEWLNISDILSDFCVAPSVRQALHSFCWGVLVFSPWRRGSESRSCWCDQRAPALTWRWPQRSRSRLPDRCVSFGLYLLTHPVCVACEDSITQQHRRQKLRHQTETWTTTRNFFPPRCRHTPQSVTTLHMKRPNTPNCVYWPRPQFPLKKMSRFTTDLVEKWNV